jgi:hypothetical protein
MAARIRTFLQTYFYFVMSIVIAVAVTYGFCQTIDKNLIHAASPRPGVLYLHAVIFSTWLVFYIVQSGLVRMRHVLLHRTLGWFGAALGGAIVILGVSTAITMGRYHHRHDHWTLMQSQIGVPLFDITCFAIALTLAIVWHRRPEFHRRLILLASCILAGAGLARFPFARHLRYHSFEYLAIDFLVLLGVVRDLIVDRRVHKVYAYGLPAFVLGSVLLIVSLVSRLPIVMRFMQFVLG